jgi:MoaE-MoaD fusion protein
VIDSPAVPPNRPHPTLPPGPKADLLLTQQQFAGPGKRPITITRVKISVRLFAGLRERAGASHVEVELPDEAVVADLLAVMGLAPGQCVVALNREYAPVDARVLATDEVAMIPPVSGGATAAVRLAEVTADPLELAAVAAAVRDPRAGGVVCFEGVTREVEALDYEAYVEMAREKLRAIGEEEAARHGLCAVALVHRTGRVPLSEPSVIVAASAAHRGEAFAGARALIDRVKAEAPIWKVELTDEGARRVEGVLPDSAAWRT